ncbi:MAG: hypothetical protein ABIU05_14470, partial [Nitrospirales bacterium]
LSSPFPSIQLSLSHRLPSTTAAPNFSAAICPACFPVVQAIRFMCTITLSPRRKAVKASAAASVRLITVEIENNLEAHRPY